MKNLLFIVESVPDKLFAKKIGFSFFKKKGINFNILYIAGLCRPNYYKKTKSKADIKFFDGKNKEFIINFLKEKVNNNTIVFCYYRKNNKTIFINKLLQTKNIKTAFVSMESSLQNKNSFINKLKILFINPVLFLKLLLIKISYFENFKLNYNYIFTAGKLSEDYYKKNSNSKIFKIHHYDLDFVKKSKSFNKDKNYALFLSPASVHPDIYDNNPGLGNENNLTWFNEDYTKKMREFLSELSNLTNTKVIIAEHPKETLNLKSLLNFKSYRGISSELVKNANFVLCFDSTAYQLAVLCNKPILFLTSKNLPKFVQDNIKNRCLFFEKYPINIENKLNKKELKFNLKLNKKIYRKYIKLYISNTKKSFYKYRSYELILKYIKNVT